MVKQEKESVPKKISGSLIGVSGGVLKEMMETNRRRLQDEFFSPKEVFLDKNNEWSGDWQGRDFLAQLYHTKVSGICTEHLHGLIDGLEAHLNEGGYFGKIVDPQAIGEQQLAGNSWFLRALCLWHEMGDARALPAIKKIVDNLYLPLRERFKDYPKHRNGKNEGSFEGRVMDNGESGFLLSSDVGCLYISLDGLTHAYEYYPSAELCSLIEQLIESFAQTDIKDNKFQAHATLTVIRAILKFYSITGKENYLGLAARLFKLYTDHCMTVNFANYNWFGRPEFTEPCAIIDSIMASRLLYRFTNDISYLQYVYRIFYNALVFAQRENGGMGCDRCATAENDLLAADLYAYEAYWCCTMRGAEGLCSLAEFETQNGVPVIDFLYECTLPFGENKIEIHTQFPYQNAVEIAGDTAIGTRLIVCLPLAAQIKTIKGATASIERDRLTICQTAENFLLELCFLPEFTYTKRGDKMIVDYGILRLCHSNKAGDFTCIVGDKIMQSVPRMLTCRDKSDGLRVEANFFM